MRDGIGKGTGFHSKIPPSRYLKTEIMSRLSALPPPVSRGNSTPSQSSLNESQEEPSFSAAMKAIISRKKKPEQTKPQSSSSSQEEAVSNSDYLEKPLLSQSANPLEFWKEMSNGDRYQQAFAKVAKFFLTPPCSTVDVERLFATAGQIYTPKRMSLNAPKVENSLFLNQNMKHV